MLFKMAYANMRGNMPLWTKIYATFGKNFTYFKKLFMLTQLNLRTEVKFSGYKLTFRRPNDNMKVTFYPGKLLSFLPKIIPYFEKWAKIYYTISPMHCTDMMSCTVLVWYLV